MAKEAALSIFEGLHDGHSLIVARKLPSGKLGNVPAEQVLKLQRLAAPITRHDHIILVPHPADPTLDLGSVEGLLLTVALDLVLADAAHEEPHEPSSRLLGRDGFQLDLSFVEDYLL